MDPNAKPLLPSHSMAERHFYLMVLACDKCGKGPQEFVSSEQSPDQKVDIWVVRCRQCRQGQRLHFNRATLTVDEAGSVESSVPEVNPSSEPSRLIDVGQWIALFTRIITTASNKEDRKEAQHLGYEGTLCLEEALKFYKPDSDLPPPEAVWTPASKQSFQEHPELFLKQRLLQMREKLPSLNVMRKAIDHSLTGQLEQTNGHGKSKKHWWSKWFGT